jgi:hypothetical protein
MRANFVLRATGLLAIGAIVLHQADYRLGGAGHGALGGHGHGYMPLALALAVVVLGLACFNFAGSLWRALHGVHDDPAPPSFRRLWLTLSIALLTVFSLQEWIESWVAPGHPSGVSHVAAHVGWMGVLLAVVLGALAGALLRGAHSATCLLAKRHASLRRLRPASCRGLPLPGPDLPRLDVLAVHRAGRAPPLLYG